jgi:Family of unknown function (DUF6084)
MSQYTFSVLDVVAEPYAASPQLTARLRIEESSGRTVHAIALRSQVRIEPQRRGYSEADEGGLQVLFGGRERWVDTLRPFLWMQCSTTVQGFTGVTEADLPLPCTYDFDVVGSRYLHAVGEGRVPLSFMFSGTVFTRGSNGFGVEQVPWDCDCRYAMPVGVWKQMIDRYYPRTAWLRLDRDVIDRVAYYRERQGLTSWEETLDRLLTREGEVIA